MWAQKTEVKAGHDSSKRGHAYTKETVSDTDLAQNCKLQGFDLPLW